MKKLKRSFVILAAVAACIVFTAAQSHAQTILHKITGKKSTVYLLGSIHLATPECYPIPDYIYKAFNDSDTLVVEINPLNFAQEDLVSYGTYKDKTFLQDHISKETFNKLRSAFESIKLPEFLWSKMKPFIALTTYSYHKTIGVGASPDLGIDKHFAERALELNKTIIQLESFGYQMRLFDSLDTKTIERIIVKTIDEYDSIAPAMNRLINAWKTGDENELLDLLNAEYQSDDDRIVREILLDNRNVNMAEKIKKMLDGKGKYFVVVGAAHVFGKGGILDLLGKSKKYKIKKVK